MYVCVYSRQWEPEPGYLGSLYSNCCGNTAGRLCGIGIYRGIMKPPYCNNNTTLLLPVLITFLYVPLIDDKDCKTDKNRIITASSWFTAHLSAAVIMLKNTKEKIQSVTYKSRAKKINVWHLTAQLSLINQFLCKVSYPHLWTK